MKERKLTLVILSIIFTIIAMIIPSKVKAVTNLTTPIYFGVNEFRSGTTPNNMAYGIMDPHANGTEATKGAIIWQIKKYNSNNKNDSDPGTVGNFYCVKAGIGFQNTGDIATYNRTYNLRTDKEDIQNIIMKINNDDTEYKIAKGEWEIYVLLDEYEDPENSKYKDIKDKIAKGEYKIVREEQTSEEGKTIVLEYNYYNNLLALTDLLYLKGITTEEEKTELLENAGIYTNYLTDSDIEAVQQSAIWYYTNHENPLYDNVNKENINKTSWLFYNTLERQQAGDGYTSLSDYDLRFDENGDKVGAGLARQSQAVLLYNYLINTANQNASTYENGTAESRTTVTLYTTQNPSDANSTQPIIEIERTPDVKVFDLALRKYITKVGDETLTGSTSRIPNIDLSTLTDGTTATYKHRKDPVVVKTGDVVTYSLTIYNEGDKAGRATKIVDQLPTGLKFSKINTEGFETNYNETTNTLTITRSENNKRNLEAYTENNLQSETIEIECIVTEKASTSSEKILTNVAWIAEEYDAVKKETITNEVGKDRDSEPSTVPSVNKDNMTNYKGNDNKADLADPNEYYRGQQDDDDFEKLKLEKEIEGKYNLVLVKQDADGKQLNSQATFEVNGETKTVTGQLQVATDVKITSDNVERKDTYTIKETVPPDKYCKFDGTIIVTVTKAKVNSEYKVKEVTYKVVDENGKDITSEKEGDVNVYLNSEGNIYVEVKNYQFDLKLVKRIVEVNGNKVPERILGVDITKLANGTATTADYKLDKEPVAVKQGDIVKYTLRVYNEGDIDGYASEISEDIPEGLEFLWSEKTGSELDSDTTLTQAEKEAIKYNQGIWDIKTVNTQTSKVEMITTDYLAKGKGAEIATDEANLIKAFDSSKKYTNTIDDKNPDYKEISVMMKVVAENQTGVIIRNEAAITEDTDSKGNTVNDRDSNTDNWVKYEDDEDYDNVILKVFDIALRKFVISVGNKEETSLNNISIDRKLLNEDGKYAREPQVDTSKLNTLDENGKLITTATYNHTKEPVEVKVGDYVVYMLRAYNEGELDGYAAQITDYLPPYLEYVDGEFNKTYGWTVSKDGRIVTTSYLDKHIIEKATTNNNNQIVLSYKEVPILCKVKSEAKTSEEITNIAEISIYKDENKNSVVDRDSEQNNIKLPKDEELPSYKSDEKGSYIPGQQDDDDFEKLIIRPFDLALRKFITRVNDEEVTSRIPQIEYDKENNQITYNHTKEPVEVLNSDIVTYTIRVYNEGEVDGYASEITDDIPEGLEYLPENELNKEYRWVMYDKEGKETTEISEAVKIKTDYLSFEQGAERVKEDEKGENPALLKAFDGNKEISETNPDYADVKVAFKVIEPATSDRIIINSAQISEDRDGKNEPIDDIDSIPDEWNEGEDDQDKEYIKLRYFDLALRKWVTQAIVIENGKETITQTGHKPEDDPEDVVKVEIHRKKVNDVIVKFKYSIRVTNEGNIAGYAKEITDYVPQGLKFVAEDNKGWTDEGNNVISTRLLENTLLQPGEHADVEVTLTWINSSDNMGLKVNIAEISEDYNDKKAPDIDSTPDNKKEGEDDIDDAPVMLAIKTGQVRIYFTLGFTVLITLAGGIALIKKYVL